MKRPDWIEPFEPCFSISRRVERRAMTDDEIYEFLGDNPFEEWNISDAFRAGKHSIGYIVNSSMALALQHVAISGWDDGVCIDSIGGDPGIAHVKWEDLFEDAIELLEKEEMLSFASKLKSIANKIEERANAEGSEA